MKLVDLQFTIYNLRLRSGQALVVLLVFVATATIITGAAVTVTLINSQTATKFASGEEALAVAEAGAENAIVKLFQNPNYAGELSFAVGSGTADISVSGTATKTITSIGKANNFYRTVRVIGTFTNFTFTTTSWQQID